MDIKDNKKIDCEVVKFNRHVFENNIFIVKLGSDDRPASEADMEDFSEKLSALLETIGIDRSAFLVTYHNISFETIDKDKIKTIINSLI